MRKRVMDFYIFFVPLHGKEQLHPVRGIGLRAFGFNPAPLGIQKEYQ